LIIIVVVLPDPGDASSSIGPSILPTACRCTSFNSTCDCLLIKNCSSMYSLHFFTFCIKKSPVMETTHNLGIFNYDWSVINKGPSAVMASVCSYCADRLPSTVLAVQPSSSIFA